MAFPRLNLIVVRSLDPERTKGFFELLGIRFQEEQHGNGPIHWAADLDGLVLEVYPAKSEDEVCGPSRLGLEVEGISAVLDGLRTAGVEVVSDLKKSKWELRAVVRDPDGRSVELVQR